MKWKSFFTRYAIVSSLTVVSIFFASDWKTFFEKSFASNSDSLFVLGEDLNSKWIGDVEVSPSLSFLIFAGHADSQGIAGPWPRKVPGQPRKNKEIQDKQRKT